MIKGNRCSKAVKPEQDRNLSRYLDWFFGGFKEKSTP